MRGVYTAEIEISSFATAITGILLECPADSVLEIISASITNMDTDSNEQLEAGIIMVTTKGAPAGTAMTPEPHETGDAASGVTALGELTTEPTTYNTVMIDRQGFSNLAGYRYDPLPEEKPIDSPSGLLGLKLLSAPSAGFKAACMIVYRELGG